MKIYRYIFHKYYVLFSGFTDSAGFAVNILLCWIAMLNTFTLIDYFLHDTQLSELINKTIIIIYIVLLLIGHFSYFNSIRAERIVNHEFKDENITFGRIGILGAVLFAILSFWFFFNYTVPFVGNN